MSKNNNTEGAKRGAVAAYFLRIAGVLTLICSVVALMLAVIDTVTKDTIAANTEKEKVEAISRIFGDIDGALVADGEDHEIYLVMKDGDAIGYTVTVKPQGYGGEIEMLVGISPEKTVVGTQIISMSETPGVGSRVKSDPDFLPQFEGRGEAFVIGENVDAISGASISSKAVTAGINEALSVEFDVEAAKAALAKDTEEAETEPAETESEAAETSPTVPPVTEEEVVTEPDTYIDPNSVGAGDVAYNNYPSDNITVIQRDTTYYLEHETTDTESETEPETDENGNPIEPETTETGDAAKA